MKQIVAVDPGLNACGLAIFDGDTGRLAHAELVENKEHGDLPSRWYGAARAVSDALFEDDRRDRFSRTLLVEMPRVYPAARQKGDQNDLMNLVGVVASLASLIPAEGRRLIYPRSWKGTLDADDMIERIKGRLTAVEHRAVKLPSAAGLQHNVWDAIGIGLHALGRLEPKRVIAR
jgi:hypothetical protein